MLGLIARSGSLAVSAGLVFLLSQQAPRLDGLEAPAKSTLFQDYRNRILIGLERVRLDLETNGQLLIPARRLAGALAESRPTPPLQLDRRTLPAHPITD